MNAQKALHLRITLFLLPPLVCCGDQIFWQMAKTASEPHNFTLWTHLKATAMKVSILPPGGLHDSPPFLKVGCMRSLGEMSIKSWLVVEPTHLKNMLVKLGSSSPSRDENKKCLKPPPSNLLRIVATDHIQWTPSSLPREFPTPKMFRDSQWLVRCRRRPKLKVFANLRFFGAFDPFGHAQADEAEDPWSRSHGRRFSGRFTDPCFPINLSPFM